MHGSPPRGACYARPLPPGGGASFARADGAYTGQVRRGAAGPAGGGGGGHRVHGSGRPHLALPPRRSVWIDGGGARRGAERGSGAVRGRGVAPRAASCCARRRQRAAAREAATGAQVLVVERRRLLPLGSMPPRRMASLRSYGSRP